MGIAAIALASLAVVAGPAPRADRSPVWSPDGRQLAFVREAVPHLGSTRFASLVVARVEFARRVGQMRALAGRRMGGGSSTSASVSMRPPALPDVVVVRSDGSGARRVGAGQTPLCSPQGQAIAYLRYDGLDVVRPDGGAKRRLVVPAPRGLWAWSADGTLLDARTMRSPTRSDSARMSVLHMSLRRSKGSSGTRYAYGWIMIQVHILACRNGSGVAWASVGECPLKT